MLPTEPVGIPALEALSRTRVALTRWGPAMRAEGDPVDDRPPVTDRLLAALIHHDGGAVRVKCVLEECEVERAPEQRAALGHHSLDHGTR